MSHINSRLESIEELIDILNKIRVGCPWDREQTIESLKMLTVEECFELVDAINNNDIENIKEELGDILMHIIFYAKIAEERGFFNLGDVAKGVSDKLVYRHPHVFSDTIANTSDEVVTNWEILKKKRKKKDSGGVLSGVPGALPALIKAYRMQYKAAAVGFDWDRPEDVWDKVDEELSEVKDAIRSQDTGKIEEEFGDLLFAVINASRKYGIDPESALEKSNMKFKRRFEHVESCCNDNNIAIEDAGLSLLDEFWNRAKLNEKRVKEEDGTN